MEKSANTIDTPQIHPSEGGQKVSVPSPSPEPAERKLELPLFNQSIRVAAIPISLLAGLWTAGSELHNAAREKLGGMKGDASKGIPENLWFRDIDAKYSPKFADLHQRRKSGVLEKPDYIKELKSLRKIQSHEINIQMNKADMGFGWIGAKDITTKWSWVNTGHRQQAVVNGMAVFGVALGVMLTMSQSKSLIEFLGVKDKEKER